jgi:hypothetical protein
MYHGPLPFAGPQAKSWYLKNPNFTSTELLTLFEGKSGSSLCKRALELLEKQQMIKQISELEKKNEALTCEKEELEISLEIEIKRNTSFTEKRGFVKICRKCLKATI